MQKFSMKKPKQQRAHPRVGRGGKRGKTSGRGQKGAGARAGNKGRPEMRDIIKKYPKRRGMGKNRAHTVVPRSGSQVVNLDQLQKHFENGAEITPHSLFELGLIRRDGGRLPKVKVLSRGDISKKLTFKKVAVSEEARARIEKAGGTIEL